MKVSNQLIAGLSLTLSLTAVAEPLPPAVADMECLVGAWKGNGTLTQGNEKAKLDATWSCKRTSAKFGVLCTLRVTGIPGVPSYEETDLMGYEPNTNSYHWYSVTNAGETHDHVAQPNGGDSLQFVFNGTQDNKPFKEVILLAFAKGNNSVSGRSETFVAGTSTSVLELKLHK